jgi:hypothetical protein
LYRSITLVCTGYWTGDLTDRFLWPDRHVSTSQTTRFYDPDDKFLRLIWYISSYDPINLVSTTASLMLYDDFKF